MEKEEYFDSVDLLKTYPINTDNEDDEDIELKKPEEMKDKAFDAYKIEPRFWSLDHLYIIVSKFINCSKVRKRQNLTNQGIKKCLDTLEVVEKDMNLLQSNVKSKFNKIEMEMEINNKEQDVIIQDHDVKLKSIFDMLENQN